MSAVPSLRSWASGELATAALMNQNIRDPSSFFKQRPMISCFLDANQSITNNTWTAISGWKTLLDTDNGRSDTGPTPNRNYAMRPGLYDVRAQALFASDVDKGRGLAIDRITSLGVRTTVVESGQFSSGGTPDGGSPLVETAVQTADPGVYLDAGDYLEVVVFHLAGAALNVLGHATEQYTWFCMRWVAAI